TYSTNAEVDAKAFTSDALFAFLSEVDQDDAMFIKNLDAKFAYVWNYAGKSGTSPSSEFDTSSSFLKRILWSNLDGIFSWQGQNVPGDSNNDSGVEQNALFASAIPYTPKNYSGLNHVVQVNGIYTINGVFFNYAPDVTDMTATSGFTLAKLKSTSTTQYLKFENAATLYTEISTLSDDTGKAHTITAPIKIMQPLIVNTTNSASNVSVSDVYNNATSSSTSSDGVIKQGAGTLILNTASTANSDSYGHKVRFVLDGGTLQFAGNNAVNGYPDDGGQAGVILNGGRWNMNGYDQDFYNSGGYNGILTVTNHSELSFGANVSSTKNTPSLLWVSSVEISGGQLNVYNYAMKDGSTVRPNASSASTSPLWTSKWDTFYSAYPGLPVLGNIVFKDLTQFWSATNTKKITGRWRVISGTYGEIIPRRPPKSSGIAYLSVSNNSRIFFEGTSKLSVEDISIYNGVLEIRNWSAGDNLFVAPNKDGDTQDVTTYDVYLNCYYLNGAAKSKSKAIRFYNDAGQFVGYGNLVGPIDVTRTDIETGKVVTNYNVYRVTPKL
ncbi:MAG TPA: hypothetical protein PKI32_05630, partial [Opitutales bacterium]|nr:hypothetical protein [Opitutales bacterium]